MKRWNGWGNETTHYPLPDSAANYLLQILGQGCTSQDAALETVLAAIPDSRLPPHPLVTPDPEERLRHARGQSLPDWIALRSGQVEAFPDGVTYPQTEADIRALLSFARDTGTSLIPYGGGTSVVGHINPLPDGAPTLTVDLSRMRRLLHLDQKARLATFEAGVPGPELERLLNARGFTLGHFPQSFEHSTLGGWVATRSSGQQSYYYGRIEYLFAGGYLETPSGSLELPPHPASAAGPDLRNLVLGSEGRLGIITRATVQIRPLPETESFYGVFFRDWEAGIATVQALVQEGLGLSMIRLSDAQETETTLALSGKERLIVYAYRGLGLLGYGTERCLLIFGLTGSRRETIFARNEALAIARQHAGLFTGEMIGKLWRKSRFLTPYLRNELWERGYALDTLETALPWPKVLPAAGSIKVALQQEGVRNGGKILVFAHLSHVYPMGASLYVTFVFPRLTDPGNTLERWRGLKAAGSQAVLAHGGTISHQHGVGLDHAPYLEAEKGPLGMSLLNSAFRELDPEGIMNPGKLVIR